MVGDSWEIKLTIQALGISIPVFWCHMSGKQLDIFKKYSVVCFSEDEGPRLCTHTLRVEGIGLDSGIGSYFLEWVHYRNKIQWPLHDLMVCVTSICMTDITTKVSWNKILASVLFLEIVHGCASTWSTRASYATAWYRWIMLSAEQYEMNVWKMYTQDDTEPYNRLPQCDCSKIDHQTPRCRGI